MAQAKTAPFDPILVRTAGLAKALAHPARLRILEILAERQSCLCGCLVGLLPLAQSTVSQHLRELRDAGLVRGDIDGPRTCFCLDPKALVEIRTALTEVLRRTGGTRSGEPAGPVPGSRRPCAPLRGARQKAGRPKRPKIRRNQERRKETS